MKFVFADFYCIKISSLERDLSAEEFDPLCIPSLNQQACIQPNTKIPKNHMEMVEETHLTGLKVLKPTPLLESSFLLKKPQPKPLPQYCSASPKECNNLGNGHLQEIPGFSCFWASQRNQNFSEFLRFYCSKHVLLRDIPFKILISMQL